MKIAEKVNEKRANKETSEGTEKKDKETRNELDYEKSEAPAAKTDREKTGDANS